MANDLSALGYTCEFQRLDAQRFLLRQRRKRIWGTADLTSSASKTYGERMAQTVRCLESDMKFPSEACFDSSLPEQSLPDQKKNQMNTFLADAKLLDGSTDVFMDISKSDSRPECATGVTTCIRPTHPIWSHRLGRKLTVQEMWTCQGYWMDDFPSPEFVDAFLKESATKAQDLAGMDHKSEF